MSGPAVLVVDGLRKDYDGRRVLGPVSFEVAAGTVLALLGRNGSGKSTTLAAVAGVLDPTEGTISVAGMKLLPSSDQPDYRRRIAYVPDEPLLFPDLTMRAHAAYVAGAWEVPDGEHKFADLMSRLGLGEVLDAVPATFSRGMRQKSGLALAFLRPADLLLIDEPFSGLDTAGRVTFLQLLSEAVSAGASAVVATHATEQVKDFADQVLLLADGGAVLYGSPGHVLVTDDADSSPPGPPIVDT